MRIAFGARFLISALHVKQVQPRRYQVPDARGVGGGIGEALDAESARDADDFFTHCGYRGLAR